MTAAVDGEIPSRDSGEGRRQLKGRFAIFYFLGLTLAGVSALLISALIDGDA